jgi:ribosomal protein S18 acetylase RimI-like enzyme
MPEATVQIRRGGVADAAEIATVLLQSFLEFESQYTPGGFAATTPDWHQVRERIAEGPAWVALHEQKIVGTASAVEKGDDGLYVRGMAVLPPARGMRIGELLLTEIEAFAVSRGCQRLFLSTTPFLRSAIRLYERFGFRRTKEEPEELFGTPLFTMAKELKLNRTC